MKMPCDTVAVPVTGATAPCQPAARVWILAAAILGSSLAFIDGTVVNVALPAIQATFHSTLVDVQWVVESYGLFLGALILVGGSLGDLFGRRLIFLIGVAIFAVASAACGAAPNIHLLIYARAIQGAGAALLVPGSLAIISASFDEKSRGQAIGTWSGFTAITAAIGPVLGGSLVEHASWRWVFLINLPIAMAVIFISVWRVPESRNATAGSIDKSGAFVATVGLGGLIVGLIESDNLGWTNPLVYGGLIVGVGCLVAFVFIEANVKSPMLPLALFESPTFTGANLITLFLYGAIGVFFFLFPLNLIQVQGYSATAAGAAMLPLILLMFFLSRWSGGLVARYGARVPLTLGPLIAALGFGLFAIPSTGQSYWTAIFPAMVVLGFGMAVAVAPLTTSVMSSVSEERVGTASGINNAVARVASVLAIAVFGIVMVRAFSFRLERGLAEISLPAGVLEVIRTGMNKLAGLSVPGGLNASTANLVKKAIAEAFVFGYRIVILSCATLSLMSAGIAWVGIPKSVIPKRDLPRSGDPNNGGGDRGQGSV
jgi:EmrB/QacA subfamily drug resistance transporter